MDYGLNLKAFLKDLPLSHMTGHQKFLASAALQCHGRTTVCGTTKVIQLNWRKSSLGIRYNPAFYERAQQEGWVDPVSGVKGTFVVTQNGLDHLEALPSIEMPSNGGGLKQINRLFIVNRKATHSFDKLLRNIFAESKTQVSIADSWVDETIFDSVLDVIPKSVPVRLLYANVKGSFDQRARRFSIEYGRFAVRRYKPLHDRFIVADESAYVLGPSMKDAASKSPGLVIALDSREKRSLLSHFDELWKLGKAPI